MIPNLDLSPDNIKMLNSPNHRHRGGGSPRGGRLGAAVTFKNMKSLLSSSAPSSFVVLGRHRLISPPYYLLALLLLTLFVAFLFGEDALCIFQSLPRPSQSFLRNGEKNRKRHEKLPFAIGEDLEGCDVFSGRWVRDETGRPLYEESECPYIQPQLTCQEHGRPDKEYQHWRWQPHGCSLPRFNATLVLETLRGKRMMFVGDSLNRGQYVSMVCLLHSIIPQASKSMETFGSLTVFTAKDYNATIEFYWAPFLLESNSDDAAVHRISDRMIRQGSINKHGKNWKGVDIIVFNTYLWWMTGQKMKMLRGSFEDEVKDLVAMKTEDAYRIALKSMVRWVHKNMNPNKTRVFFTSMSPHHPESEEWGEPGGNCYNQTTPIEDPNFWGKGASKSIMAVIGEVFPESKVPITLLNISQLSGYRKDAHTQIYKKQWSPLTPEQIAKPTSYADCVHWCLPGLQDTWNELLFAKLFYP